MNYLISDGIVMMRKALRRKEQLIVMRVGRSRMRLTGNVIKCNIIHGINTELQKNVETSKIKTVKTANQSPFRSLK
jgi:hypothetical protein